MTLLSKTKRRIVTVTYCQLDVTIAYATCACVRVGANVSVCMYACAWICHSVVCVCVCVVTYWPGRVQDPWYRGSAHLFQQVMPQTGTICNPKTNHHVQSHGCLCRISRAFYCQILTRSGSRIQVSSEWKLESWMVTTGFFSNGSLEKNPASGLWPFKNPSPPDQSTATHCIAPQRTSVHKRR